MDVRCIIPYLGGCPHRQAALAWVKACHRYPVTIAAGGRPWIKAEALAPALEASDADVVIVADADVWTEGFQDAVRAVSEGASWARPYARVHRLTPEGTRRVLGGEGPGTQPLLEPAYRGVLAGGAVVARREVLVEIPMDPRFIGYGQEDEALGAALRTLAGRPWRGKAPLYHLYHPPAPRLNRRVGSTASWELYTRYMTARRDPGAMRQLIEEIHAHRANAAGGDDPAENRIGNR